MRIFKKIFAVIFFVIVLSVSIHAGDIAGKKCKTCGNLISDQRFAAVMEEDSKIWHFDDIGCAVQYLKGKCQTGSTECNFTVQVFDYDTGESVHIRASYYVQARKIKTPRGSGIAAFKEKKNAERFLKANGLAGILDFEDLK